MRFSSYALPALAANLAAALPAPQDINLSMVADAPDPTYSEAIGVAAQTVTYDTSSLIASASAAASSVSIAVSDVLSETAVASAPAKRAVNTPTACAVQPTGAPNVPTYARADDTAANFLANTYYSTAANGATTPSDYTLAFSNMQASSGAFGYMGFDTLDSYDVATCTSRCTAKNGCVSVNIYFERDPSVNPDSPDCIDPPSVTMIKCVYWGGPVSTDNTVNVGQPRGNFHVAIAGSNGYVTNKLATPAGYTDGTPYGKNAINAPYDAQGYNTFMGSKIFTSTWDVASCAAYCDSQTKYNLATAPKDGTPAKVCKFFNTYVLTAYKADKSVVVQGQYCALYTEVWDKSYATNAGQWRGQDQYLVSYSFGYPKSDPGIAPIVGDSKGAIYQARQDMTYYASQLTATFQPYCSSLLGYTPLVATTTPSATFTPFTTATATVTVPPNGKLRRDGSSPSVSLVIPWPTDVPNPFEKRAAPASTPNVLTKYPAAVQSGACSLIVTQATSTSTTTAATVTVTASTQTSTLTSTVTAAAAPSGALKIQGGSYDGLFIRVAFYSDGRTGIYLTTRDPTQATVVTLDSQSRLSSRSGFAPVLNLATDYDNPDPYNNAFVEIGNTYLGTYPTCNFASGSLSCNAGGQDRRNLLQMCPNWPTQAYGTGPYLTLNRAPISGCETVKIVQVQ